MSPALRLPRGGAPRRACGAALALGRAPAETSAGSRESLREAHSAAALPLASRPAVADSARSCMHRAGGAVESMVTCRDAPEGDAGPNLSSTASGIRGGTSEGRGACGLLAAAALRWHRSAGAADALHSTTHDRGAGHPATWVPGDAGHSSAVPSKAGTSTPWLKHARQVGTARPFCWAPARFLTSGVGGGAGSEALEDEVPVEEREQMEYDVLVVGAGPAGLAAAIRLKQLSPALSVCVLEKGAQAGSHILSGNVFEPRALDELFPDWRDRGAPLRVPVVEDRFRYLASSSLSIPVPAPGSNHGNFVISLSELVRWLAAEAEQLGVEVYPGIAGTSFLLCDPKTGSLQISNPEEFAQVGTSGGQEVRRVVGMVTGDVGRDKNGQPRDSFQPGMVLRAKATLLAEGCRGSLSQDAIQRYALRTRAGAQHQTYGLGVKEVWRVDPAQHRPGSVLHTLGYPLDSRTYGGGFLYHMDEGLVALGLVVGLDYRNPFLSPFQEFQKWKLHPEIRQVLEGGTVVQYGARALNEGGLQSLPHLVFPGGALVGCAAGFLNVPKIKGTHTAIKSGMLAAEALAAAFSERAETSVLQGAGAPVETSAEGAELVASTAPEPCAVDAALAGYPEKLRGSWVWDELRRVRNVRPGFHWGLIPGLINSAFELFIARGHSPWTLPHGLPDNACLEEASKVGTPVVYPKPDGKITFDILTSVYRSSTNHNHEQPCHLKLKDSAAPLRVNLLLYGGPEARYCPARVYEYIRDERGQEQLQINAQNCLHCKACDIKDPTQNIVWTPPEGGGGPGYTVM